VLTVFVPTMIDAARHCLMRTMLNANWHPIGGRIFTGGVSGATGSSAELGDVFEGHDDSLFFRVGRGRWMFCNLT
jgi:hypothetical protein